MLTSREEEIVPGIYTNAPSITSGFDPAYSEIYIVKEGVEGLVAQDSRGKEHKIYSLEETAKIIEPTESLSNKVLASTLFPCRSLELKALASKLGRARDRVPALIYMLEEVEVLSSIQKQSQPKCTDEETTFPFPFEDPNSPGHNPFKKGGDNPNPHIKY